MKKRTSVSMDLERLDRVLRNKRAGLPLLASHARLPNACVGELAYMDLFPDNKRS